MLFHHRLAVTHDEFEAVARSRCTEGDCTTILRPSRRDIITGEDGWLVLEEIGEVPKPTGCYARVKLDKSAVVCKELKDLSATEITATGLTPTRVEGFLRQYAIDLGDEAYYKAQNEGKDPKAAFDTAISELNSWQQGEQKAGYSRQQIALLLSMQQNYANMTWTNPVTVIPFTDPERISKSQAEAIMAASEQAGRAAQMQAAAAIG